MIIIGIDPGIAIVGYGVIEYSGNKATVIDYGAVTTKAHTPQALRLGKIFEGLNFLIQKYRPEVMGIEELFFNNNAKTVISVAEGRGVCMLCATVSDIPVFEYTPLQVKQALTGYGRADKAQMQSMVRAMLNLKEIPKPDDAADALAIALCHANSMRFNMLTGNR